MTTKLSLMTLACAVSIGALSAAEAPRPRWICSECAVPTFERAVTLESKPASAVLDLAVAGWYELEINGRRVGDAVLEPFVADYLACTPGVRVDVADFLKAGTNTFAITLAPGWFGCRTKDEWGFASAPWLSRMLRPAIRGTLVADGRQVLRTDATWTQVSSPVTNVSFRAGETYDARLAANPPPRKPAVLLEYPPRGAVRYDGDRLPVRAYEAFEPKASVTLADGSVRHDFGVNLAGWCEVEVVGEKGATVVLDHDERVRPEDGQPHGGVRVFVRDAVAQRDTYVLAGRPEGEAWHPRFTFHGFRYVWVKTTGKVSVKAIRARVLHSDLAETGGVETDNADFNALLKATRRSYLSNFVGMPTDCPHREKNGWTGDAQLAMEAGLWNWDGAKAYRGYLRMMLDSQRANGQVACILPVATDFGFDWGTGPGWDALLFECPWQLWRFGGDTATLAEAYPHAVRYLDYLDGRIEDDGTVAFGLGDWCPADWDHLSNRDVLVTAIVCGMYDRAAAFADALGRDADAARWRRSAAAMRAAWRTKFGRGDGAVASNYTSELALALAFDMLPEGERAACAKRLAERVRANAHRVDFGLFGGKYVPRMLAEYGYADDAFELFVQKKDPGWQSMLKTGDGALWEEFDGRNSHNHIMYGDNLAWVYAYVAGLRILAPGFARVRIRPNFVRKIGRFAAWHRTPYGRLGVQWVRKDGKVALTVDIPAGVKADVALPDGRVMPAPAGRNEFTCP